jgi:glycosyltransferase involved in cell wall biosynthesis
LKVVHVITELERGGTEVMLYRLLERMDPRRFLHVVVSLADEGTLGPTIVNLGVPVRALGMRRRISDVRAVWRLARLMRQERPEVLQTWLYHADLVGLIAGKLAGIRAIVWNVRCSDVDMRQYSWSSGLTRRLLSALSAAPAAVIVNSERGREVHERIGYRPRRWVTIPNGVDLVRFRPDPDARVRLRKELGLPLSTRLIGMVARYDPMKDHATFLRAAAEFLRNGAAGGQADVHFVLVGRRVTWENPRLRALADGLGLRAHLHLLGERGDVECVLPGLDLASLSSLFGEGWPNVVGEAMACGVPCVVTDVGDAGAIVGETGRVVPPGHPEALARAWAELLACPEEQRRALGAAARERIAACFSLEQVVNQYEALWEQLAAGSGRWPDRRGCGAGAALAV